MSADSQVPYESFENTISPENEAKPSYRSCSPIDGIAENREAIGSGAVVESSYLLFFQVVFPFSIAGVGMVFAGVVLDLVQHWRLFKEVPEIFILVPALLGLKGNLEMTLASRLSTLANLGHLDSSAQRRDVILSNLALIQIQATVIAFLASAFAMALAWIPRGQLDWSHAALLCASSLATACFASLILSVLMALVVVLSRKYNINPDNVATPIAASLGDLTTLAVLSTVGSIFLEAHLTESWLNVTVILVILLISPIWIRLALRDEGTKEVMSDGWSPIIFAMLMSSGGGFILENAIRQYPKVAIFQPVINGVGGNLAAVQASRLSTFFHKTATAGELPFEWPIQRFYSVKRAFFSKDSDSRSARVLLFLVVPGHIVFNWLIRFFHFGASIPPHGALFTSLYLIAAITQVVILLYICQFMVAVMWTWRINPDNSAIPYLTALGDVLAFNLRQFLIFTFMIKVGDRVSVGGHGATVRYVGDVSGHPGHWVGVEWDDSDRGRHDGVVGGVRYFQTRAAKGGSLVKIQNVSPGVDLLTAILNRYADNVDENVLVVSSKAVELVGMQSTSVKQSNVFELQHIVLESCSVAEPPPETSTLFKSCVTLNLFNNLLYRWDDVRKILKFFPKIRELVLRRNRMEAAVIGETWNEVVSLRDLILSDCGLTSESICNILLYLPCVRNLYAVGNLLNQLRVPSLANNLTVVDISSNPIKCISNVNGNLKKLEKLCLSACGIQRILIEDGQFPSLNTLNIKENKISEWESINRLQNLPQLSVLYIDCENLSCLPGIDVHEVIIAKLAGLVDLNRFDVSAIERQSAEVRFLDKYFSAEDSLKADHIRDIERLKKVHGVVVVNSKSCGLSVVPLSICYRNETVRKRVPMGITVQKLTEMIGRVFSVGSMSVKLELDKGTHMIELDNPMRSLDFYSPEPDDVLRLVTT